MQQNLPSTGRPETTHEIYICADFHQTIPTQNNAEKGTDAEPETKRQNEHNARGIASWEIIPWEMTDRAKEPMRQKPGTVIFEADQDGRKSQLGMPMGIRYNAETENGKSANNFPGEKSEGGGGKYA